MHQTGDWTPYSGTSTYILALVLLVIAIVLAYLGVRLRKPVGVKIHGKFTGLLIVLIFLLCGLVFTINSTIFVNALVAQYGPIKPLDNPISPVTGVSTLVTFAVIAFLSRHSRWWIALGSAIVGTIAAGFIFELPFDIIVFGRTDPPNPAIQYSLLFFLPLFAMELSSYSMLALSPLTKLTRYTLFSLAGMFLVFSVWALFGFAYPATPATTACNMISKVLSFAAAICLFITPTPQEAVQDQVSLAPSADPSSKASQDFNL